MEYRQLGRTDLRVSEVGFGCGSVGGLMVRGDRDEMKRAVALAIDAGINYFDTARLYGNGQSETNLGQVLRELAADVVVGTKVKLEAPDMQDIERAVMAHVEGSLNDSDVNVSTSPPPPPAGEIETSTGRYWT